MDIKDLLGDAYKDGMTIDEINEALKGKNFVDPSSLPKSVDKSVFDKTASELAKLKKELKEYQEKTMTDEEKIQEELKKAQEAQTTYAKELSKLRAKEIFVEAGLGESDYSPILETVVSDDEETTRARAKSMVDLINAQKAAVEKAVKAELLKKTPNPPAGASGSVGGVLAEEIKEAQENGDMVTVAALIRQQAELEAKKTK